MNQGKKYANKGKGGSGAIQGGNKYVTRYRRTKNLAKRCMEISNQCELDIVLIMVDRKGNKVREVHTNQ